MRITILVLMSLADSIEAHSDFEAKYQNNNEKKNRELAFKKTFEDVILKTVEMSSSSTDC